MNEVWRKTKDPRYSVSDLGKVRNDKTGRILKPWLTNGYPTVGLGAKHKSSVHRLVAEAFIPNPDGKPEVNHKNGVKGDSYLTNLEWVTKAENGQHAYDNGLNVRRFGHKDSVGSKNAMTLLTEDDVIQIREYYKSGEYTYAKLGEKYDVNAATIAYIIQRKTWKHV